MAGSDLVNVLLLIGDDRVTGPVKDVLQLLEALRNRDCRCVLVTCLPEGADASPVREAARLRGIDLQELRYSGRNYLGLVARARALAKAEGSTIVHTYGYRQTFVGMCLKRWTGLKWVCFMTGATTEDRKARFYHRIDALMQRTADRTVVLTQAQRRQIPGGEDPSRVRVIHNAVDAEHPAPISVGGPAVRSALNIDAGTPLAVVVSRLSPEKGVDVFLRAFRLLVRRMPGARALIVGDGSLRASLEALSRALALDESVRFVGYTMTPGDYLLAADVVVLPSRSECLPNVALEAMAFGKAVVATRVGGVPEVIEDGRSGLLVASEDEPALAAAMERALTDRALSERIGLAGKSSVKERFSAASFGDAVLALYQEVAGHG
jgi:glycosyltransferase involved in cell wall biosynthesis